jgi:hypothetical protein
VKTDKAEKKINPLKKRICKCFWHKRNLWGGGGWENKFQYFFYLRILFFGYGVEEGQIKIRGESGGKRVYVY